MLFRRRRKTADAPFLHTCLDQFEDGRFRGWAFNKHAHDESITIEVHLRGRVFHSTPANVRREDLNAAGIGGNHGFDFILPPLPAIGRGELRLMAECRGSRQSISIDDVEAKIYEFYSHDENPIRLEHSSLVWGGNFERAGVSIATYEDAVYVPFSEGTLVDHDLKWGLYTSDGTLVPEAAYRRGSDLQLIGQRASCVIDHDDLDEAPFATMVYGGPLLQHYGHFLLSTLCRCWAIDGSYPVLFHSIPPPHRLRAGFIAELMRAAGLAGHSVSFDRPTRIRKIIVPQPALYEQHSITRDYSVAMSAIGRNLDPVSSRKIEKVYVSKSKLGYGITGLENEYFIDLKLQKAGYQIVYPELMGLAEQVAVFRRAKSIIGLAGSSFHTIALAPDAESSRIVLNYDDYVNSNFLLLDKFCRRSASYFTLKDDIRRVESGVFTSTFAATNINHLADKIISMADA